MKTKEFVGLTDDLVFKHVFSKMEILVDFLNSYFAFFHEKKRVVEVKASTDDPIKGNKRKHKVYYGDIMAYLDNGEMVSIEMYKSFHTREYKKSLSYISRKFANQLEKGHDYEEAKKITGINIILKNYYLRNASLVSDYVFMDKYQYREIHNECLEMVILKLDMISNIVYNQSRKRLIRWLKLMAAKSKKEMKEIAGSDEMMNKAIKYMEEFLNDEEIQDVYDKINDVEYYAKKEGQAEGRREGKKENAMEIAKNLLKTKLTFAEIADVTGLTVAQVEALK